MCLTHYQQWRRTGDPLRRPLKPIAARMAERTAAAGPDDCWEWTGHRQKRTGYGTLNVGTTQHPRNLYAHRIAYELAVGPIPTGWQIDHLCHNRGCVNPAHMEVVTPSAHSLRSQHHRWHVLKVGHRRVP